MDEPKEQDKHLLIRIYDWPYLYFVGLLIGLTVVVGFWTWSSDLRDQFQPIGVILFLGGWMLIIGGGFGHGIEKVVARDTQTKLQKRIERISIGVGLVFNIIAITFYMQTAAIDHENKPEVATPSKPTD